MILHSYGGWSGGVRVLGKLPVPGRLTIWITVGKGPAALAVSAGGGCLDIFTLICPFSSLSPSLWETFVWTFLLSSILSLLFHPLFGRRPDID